MNKWEPVKKKKVQGEKWQWFRKTGDREKEPNRPQSRPVGNCI